MKYRHNINIGIRAIEVFFKVCKSYLKLTKSFRGLSFDAQTAHVAIVFTRYTMLSLENRFNLDVRSIGELFYWTCDELADITYQEFYLLLIELMLSICQDILQLSEEKMVILLDQFLKNLPAMIKSSLEPCAWMDIFRKSPLHQRYREFLMCEVW